MNSRKWRNFFYNLDKEEPKYDPKLSLINESIFDSMDMTFLSESEIKLLIEGRKDNVINKYGDLIDEDTLGEIIEFDEQYKYKHLMWIAKQIALYDGDLDEEQHLEEIIGGVTDFIKHGNRYKKKDLNSYNNIEELLAAYQTDIIQPRIEKAKQRRAGNPVSRGFLNAGQGTVIYEDERYFVVRPDSTEASCHFGSKTRWCISQQGNSYFSQYTASEEKMFYFIKDDTKQNEDFNFKMAIEITSQGTEHDMLHYDAIWDRHDDRYPIESTDLDDLISNLHESFEMIYEIADDIASAIEEHALANMPDSPLKDLSARIEAGEWDGGYVTLNPNYEDYESPPYMNLSADVTIDYLIKSPELNSMLTAGTINIEEAEENLVVAFSEDGELVSALEEDVDIGASKWWWPSSDNYHDPVSVDILSNINSPPPSSTEDEDPHKESYIWTIRINLSGFQDHDHNGYYTSHSAEEAERFCEYMQEEWGERNELEIMEVLDHHILRFIPEYAKLNSTVFRDLKNKFLTGEHQTENENIWYTVDDDDDEDSDLNLMMRFGYDLNQEYANTRLFRAEKILNANGDEVLVTRVSGKSEVIRLVKMDLSRQSRLLRNLEKGIYNVYAAARDFGDRQLKLDFGEDWVDSFEPIFPDTPPNINIDVGVQADMSTEIVPTNPMLTITFSIYIPFHRSSAELDLIYNFFKFIQANYNELSGYIYKYIKQDVTIPPGSVGAGESMLKEELLYNIFENSLFLKEINKEIKTYNAKRKKRSTHHGN